MNHPEKLPLPPPVPTFFFYVLSLWQFVTGVRVFRGALDVGVFAGVLVAMLSGLATYLLLAVMSPLINYLGS
jgi:hypothetical protein